MKLETIMETIRADLRKCPNSRFSEIYSQSIENGATSADVREAITKMLTQDEIRITDGKWRLIASVERRKSA